MGSESLGKWQNIVTQDPQAGSPEYLDQLRKKLGADVNPAPTPGNKNGLVIWRTEETDERAIQHYLDSRRQETHDRVFVSTTQGEVVPPDKRHLIPPGSVEHKGF